MRCISSLLRQAFIVNELYPLNGFKIRIISYKKVTPEPNFMKLITNVYQYKALMHFKFH